MLEKDVTFSIRFAKSIVCQTQMTEETGLCIITPISEHRAEKESLPGMAPGPSGGY